MSSGKKNSGLHSKELFLMGLVVLIVLIIWAVFILRQDNSLDQLVTLVEFDYYPDEQENEYFQKAYRLTQIYPDSSIYISTQRLKVLQGDTNELYQMHYHNLIGSALFSNSRYNKSIESFSKALALALNNNYHVYTAHYQNNLGLANIYAGNYKEARLMLTRSLEYFSQTKDSVAIAGILNNTGLLFLKINNMENAYHYLTDAKEIFISLEYAEGLSSVFNHLGKYYIQAKDTEKPLIYFLEAIRVGKESNNAFGLIHYYDELGKYYIETDSLEKALNCFHKSDSLAIIINAIIQSCYPKLGLARSYISADRFDLALKYIEKAYHIAEQEHNEQLMHEIYKSYFELYDNTGDVDNAFEYLRKIVESEAKMLKELEITRTYNFEINRLSHRIDLQSLESQKDRLLLDRRKNHLFTVAVILVVIVIGISAAYSVNVLRLRQKQQERINLQRLKYFHEKNQAEMDAEINERKRLGAELHDGAGSLLSLAKLNLTNVIERPELDPALRRSHVEQAVKNIDDVVKEIRSISKNISPLVFNKNDLAGAITEFIEQLDKLQDYQVTLNITGLNCSLSAVIEHAIFRFVQETLNNVFKHAKAKEIDIQIIKYDSEIIAMVEDNGIGFDVEATLMNKVNGKGLKNTKTRIENLNGHFSIDSIPGRGTIVIGRIPLDS